MTTPQAADAATPPPTSTTRACIKNLPPSFDETKLKRHLQQQSQSTSLKITDCKILKTKDGRSRKIAFVGFQTAEQAKSAVEYFDRTFAGTARLSVSLAFSKKKGPPTTANGEGDSYRPWSKHSVGSSKYEQLQQEKQEEEEKDVDSKKKSKKEEGGKEENDDDDKETDEVKRKREEFLSAMGISASSKQGGKDDKVSKSKFWANDDLVAGPGGEQSASNAPVGTKKSEGSKNDGDSDSSSSIDSDSSSDSDSDDEATNSTEKEKGSKEKISSDLDFLRSKQVKTDILTDDESDDDSSSSSSDSGDSTSVSDSSDDEDDAKEPMKGKNLPPSVGPDVAEPSNNNFGKSKDAASTQPSTTLIDRLFVRNLPFTTTEEELFETFSQFGNLSSVHIPVDDSKRNKGYAFITFEHKSDAKQAMDSMDGEDFQGRLIHILPARPSTDNDVDTSDMTYKEKQALARQQEAEKSSKGWSASFLRGDAVVDNLSDRLGVSKGDVLNVKDGISSGNAAVRLALGETHIISENIAFFESHGVDVSALDSNQKKGGRSGSGGAAPAKRSKTMILVKNLPYDTSMEDLTKVFHGIGGDVPQNILLPPSKTAALVEYGHATDARRAFRRLAYKKFKHVPLYLEWAPMEAEGKRESPTSEGDATNHDVPKQGSSDTVTKQGLAEEDPSAETADVGVSQTVYIKNLNFSTTEDQLNKAFAKSGFHPRAVKIPTKAAPIKKSKKATSTNDSSGDAEMRPMSMGFGFAEFPSEEEALKAMKALQGKPVDGHALEIKLSTKSLSSSKVPATDKSSKNTKIMVRNVPFEATRTELLQLFGSFGQLKKVRLPKKFDGSHRGFAFCEFVTSKEAQNAMATLSRTHLYGRHLVLEWASAVEDDGKVTDVATAREKAKRDVMSAGFGGVMC
eukprot:CAMPEP_0201682814 /NCGR_PEP_ID=MMETSP0494-20130426/51808_1 /ASSEMBLY_ACC=CAM_ASM_000839 /TAXON_ID=420259 /ORGANISM="Thalassiosira gravida, Strain GMp14c1" /LENGTH=907 /DNA_ID=CAMNT_0048166577 /DNA_START=501 /DNA_END=3224 /DNA_ORIENTATION=+